NLISSQPFGVDPNVNGAIQTTHDTHLADAANTFELYAHRLISKFSQLANRTIAGKRNGDYRRAVVVELLNYWWSGVVWKIPTKTVDAIAHVLRRRFEISIEFESSNDNRRALSGD